MSQRSIIITLVLLFLASASILFWENARGLDPDRAGSWWSLSFAEPKDAGSLAFTVENHGESSLFGYKILSGTAVIKEASFVVEKGKSTTISPDQQAMPSERTSVIVSDGKEKKEIYR